MIFTVVILLVFALAFGVPFFTGRTSDTIDSNSARREYQDRCVLERQTASDVAQNDALVQPVGSSERIQAGIRLIRANEELRHITEAPPAGCFLPPGQAAPTPASPTTSTPSPTR